MMKRLWNLAPWLLALGAPAAACSSTVTIPADGQGGGGGAGGEVVEDDGDGGGVLDPVDGEASGGAGNGDGGLGDLGPCTMVGEVIVTGSSYSATDMCEATFECPQVDGLLVVECDGENDGTGTSLCVCMLGGKVVGTGTAPTEAPDSCVTGFGSCAGP